MGAVDLVIQSSLEVGDTRAAADRARRPRPGGGLRRAHLPQVPGRPARVRGRYEADARREIEETVIPRNLLNVLAQHLVSMAATDEWRSTTSSGS